MLNDHQLVLPIGVDKTHLNNNDRLVADSVRQGRYATNCTETVIDLQSELEIARVHDLLDRDPSHFLAASPLSGAASSPERT